MIFQQVTYNRKVIAFTSCRLIRYSNDFDTATFAGDTDLLNGQVTHQTFHSENLIHASYHNMYACVQLFLDNVMYANLKINSSEKFFQSFSGDSYSRELVVSLLTLGSAASVLVWESPSEERLPLTVLSKSSLD